MKRIVLATLCMGLFLAGCNKEEPAPLPDLPKVEIPEGVVGFYTGRLPCDNCKVRMVRMTLAEDSSVSVVQTVLTDSQKTDTLAGRFSVDSGKVAVVLSEGTHWNFQVERSGTLSLLTGAGTVYEDENGVRVDLIRILNRPSQKNVKTEQ